MTQIGQQGDKALIVSSIPGVMSVFHASFVLLSLFSVDSLSQEFIFLFCLLTRFTLSAVTSCRYVYCRHLRILNVVTTLCLWYVKTLSINRV